MIDGKRIVAVVPAGRRVSMEILMLHLLRNRYVIDEVQLWDNVPPEQPDDRRWLYTLPKVFGDWVNLIEDGKPKPWPANRRQIARFWVNCQDSDTLYFRFDDDIVYIHPGYFETLARHRLNLVPFLVFPQIWMSGLANYVNQHNREMFGTDYGAVPAFVYDNITSTVNVRFAEYVHRVLIEKIDAGEANSLLWVNPMTLDVGQLISINAFCLRGEDFARFHGQVEPNEEGFIASDLPKKYQRPNVICGDALVSHFAFWAQWPYLAQTDLLAHYKRIAEEMLVSS